MHPIKGLTLYGDYSYCDPIVTSNLADPGSVGKLVAFESRNLFTLGVEYGQKTGVFAGIDYHYVGPSYVDNHNTVPCLDYHLMSAHAGDRWENVEASVFVQNLLDEEYFSAVFSGEMFAFEGTPRSVGVSLSAKF